MLLMALALIGRGIDPAAIDWQPARIATEPWRALSAGLTRAKEQSLESEAKLERWAMALAKDAGRWAEPRVEAVGELLRRGGQDAWRVLQQAAASSRTASRTVRDGSAAHPLATIALLGLAAAFGARRWRSTSY